MRSSGSITRWLGQLKAGAADAVEPLWERYFRRLVGLARARLQGTPRRAADEEDVALSAFDSFCRGAEQGRFPQLLDRDNLWRLLVTITARKAFRLAQHRFDVRSIQAYEDDVGLICRGLCRRMGVALGLRARYRGQVCRHRLGSRGRGRIVGASTCQKDRR